MEITIEIPEPLLELLFIQAAEREISVEEIVEEAIKNYMERDEGYAG